MGIGAGFVRKEAYLLQAFLDTFVSRQKYLAPRGQERDDVSP